jgi:hypothetical protein
MSAMLLARCSAFALVLLLGQASHATEPNAGAMQATRITKEPLAGWPNTYRLSNGVIEARVVTDIGPRIVDLRPAGKDNLFHLRDRESGKQGESEWMFRGGWRLWIAPEKKETTYALDNSRCDAEVVGATMLRVTGPPQPEAGIRKQIEVTLNPGEARLRVLSRITNISDHALTYAAWSLPVLRPGGRAFVPLDVGSLTSFDAIRKLILWSYTEMHDPRYRFGDRVIEIDHATVKPAPAGQTGRRDDESKIGVDSAQGWTAYLLDGTLLLKRFPHDPRGEYPDGGSTIEVYSSHEFLELEHLGPVTTIQPGESILFPEDWWIFTDVKLSPTDPLGALGHYVVRARPSNGE